MVKRVCGLVFGLVVLAASNASAVTMGVESKHCECSLVEVKPEPHVNPPDPGWEAFVGTAEEKAAAQLADLLWEPKPEPARYVEVCIATPRRPDVPWIPGKPNDPRPFDLGPDWRPYPWIEVPRIDIPGRPVPEPALTALFGLGLLVAARRFRYAR